MEESKSFLKEWEEERNYFIDSIVLTFKYKNLTQGKVILEALAFWKFLHSKWGFHDERDPWEEESEEIEEIKESDHTNWIEIKEDLAPFLNHGNTLVGMIARIESLPTSVWRKLLWKKNFDFMSYESFLRRISGHEILAIVECYDELYLDHKVPSVFSWFEKKLYGITVEKLLSEELGNRRYKSKGAWSYNLLKWDFGFNAYPNGVYDDKKIVEISPLRFLSIKNHVNDFIVNTESGIYWWLYRTARSNYVWFPNEDVHLKKHICPGFWWTIFVHLSFWFLSPLTCILTCIAYLKNPSYWLIIPGIYGAITPLWLAIAALKLSFVKVVYKFKFIFVPVKWFKEKHPKQYEAVNNAFKIMIIATGWGFAAYFLFDKLSFPFGTVGGIWTVLLIFASIIIILGVDWDKKEERFIVRCMEVAWILTGVWSIYNLEKSYPGVLKRIFEIFWSGLKVIGVEFWEFLLWALSYVPWLVEIGVWLFWLCFPWSAIIPVLIGLIFGISKLFDRFDRLEDKKAQVVYTYLEKIFLVMGLLVTMAVISMFVVCTGLTFAHGIRIWPFVLPAIMLLVIVLVTYIFSEKAASKNPVSRNLRNIFVDKGLFVKQKSPSINYFGITKNRWLRSLSRKKLKEVGIKCDYFLSKLFPDYYQREFVINQILPKLNDKSFSNIKRIPIEKFVEIEDIEIKIRVFMQVFQGMNFEEALLRTRRTVEIRRKVWKSFLHALFVIFFPAIMIVRLILKIGGWTIFFLKKLWEYIITLKRLKALFREVCPYVAHPKELKF